MKLTLLLSGQGETPAADTVTMWRHDPAARAVWTEAADAVGEPLDRWLDEGTPADTRRAQLLSAVGSLATYAVVAREIPVAPTFVVGHSVGEVAALGIAHGLGPAQVARIAEARGRAMLDAVAAGPPTGMRAVVDPPADLVGLVEAAEGVHVANLNSARQVVISGSLAGLDAFVAATGLRTVPLAVTGAFHTPYMAPAAAALRSALDGLELPPTYGPTVVANRTALPYDRTDVLAELAAQVVSPVRWAEAVGYAHDHGSQVMLDLSSTGMLARMSDLPGVTVHRCGTPDGIDAGRRELRHVIAVEGEYDLAARALGAIVTTRNLQDDEELYRTTVIPAYQELRGMAKSAHAPVERILELVETVLVAKAVDPATRERKLADLRWRAARAAA
ncbi:ACP S-malonyltransferase [Phycicoccus flavus]|uniref:ACP S-malonyltransferase n=1 Tax=Phycicoccus flavus TaxID=2502783 RepID=UPI000FEBDCCC|nr:ACP S-malonyltransferase [Phycicoccus flavus]NHA67698.1 ACP S-malonyltransferase [Phycicoccus flavus]